MEWFSFGVKNEEIREWTEYNVVAYQNYQCDQCGHTIPAFTRYNRRVFRSGKKNLVAWREHTSCPDFCSESHKNY